MSISSLRVTSQVRAVSLLGALVGSLLTAGCSGGMSSVFGGGAAVEASAVPAAPMDAVAAFAARAVPGDQDRVVLPTGGVSRGGLVTVRLARAWNAASGRECREVQVGSPRELRSQVYCQDGARWVQARQLLLGGVAAGRP